MTTLLTKIQLVAFTLVTVLAVSYGAVSFFNVGSIFSPPYEVRAQFATPGGIYERADVDLLGVRVGSVREIMPGPGTATTVVLALDNDTKIPRDVKAMIGNKSAIGEQYVELAPQTSGGPLLRDGDLIGPEDTKAPLDVAVLLKDLQGLAASIPTDDLSTVLTELSTAFSGLGPTIGHLIDNSDRLTRVSLAGVEELNALIDGASTVLGTQVDKSEPTAEYLEALGDLSTELRTINGSVASLFENGLAAGTELSNFLADNEQALPVLLNRLVTLNEIAADRIPAVRKTLTLFPWLLELGGTGIRYCSNFDTETGKAIQETCRYDAQGRPVYAAYLAMQLSEAPGSPPYLPCTKGYEGTVKYQPDGTPVKGGGARQKVDAPPNLEAGCTAAVTDPSTPNVRGAQNVGRSSAEAPRTSPTWSMIVDNQAPPADQNGLAWLLTNPMG